MPHHKTIGILGGMGPLASANMYKLIVELAQKEFGAEQDNDFPPMIIYSLPLDGFDETGIVDKELVLKQLVDGAKKLHEAKCDFFVIACNTVHYYQNELREEIEIPLLSIVDETINEVRNQNIEKIGLLTSDSTASLKIYIEKLEKLGIEPICVNPEQQKELNNLILEVMGGRINSQNKGRILLLAKSLIDQGAEAIIIGCTELPLIDELIKDNFKTFDALEIISRHALKEAIGK
jgi:aspartate racemase